MAASIWSLLIPAMDQSEEMGKFAFIPAADWILGWHSVSASVRSHHPTFAQVQCQRRGTKSRLQRTTMMVLAVTLHNIPEGMAVGVVYAGYLAGNAKITVAARYGIVNRDRNTELPGGGDYFHAAQGRRDESVKKLLQAVCFRGLWNRSVQCSQSLAAGYIVPALPYLLSFAASDDLCDCGGTDPGNVPGGTFRPWNDLFCSGIYGDDVAGCGSWVKITE